MTNHRSFAVQLARKSGAIMRANFSLGMKKEWKSDDTPITKTDKAINALVLRSIRKQYPKHSILAEEGSDLTDSEYTWVCDPVDGTIPFSHGWPAFVFSLALTKNGKSVFGVIYDPIMNRMVVAEKGKGAFLNSKTISVQKAGRLGEQSLVNLSSSRNLLFLQKELLRRRAHISVLGSTVYASMLVATGELSGEVYGWTAPWDGAAVKIIVEEAGGKVTDIYGKDQRYDRKINGFIAAPKNIHRQLIRLIAPIARKKL